MAEQFVEIIGVAVSIIVVVAAFVALVVALIIAIGGKEDVRKWRN